MFKTMVVPESGPPSPPPLVRDPADQNELAPADDMTTVSQFYRREPHKRREQNRDQIEGDEECELFLQTSHLVNRCPRPPSPLALS
jgi:hypothetical protein